MSSSQPCIGLLGGTFDPPHLGHLIVAEQVRDQLDLDEVWFLVAKDPWQKTAVSTVTSQAIRLDMVRAMVAKTGVTYLKASNFEFGLDGPTYTTRTLAELGVAHPDVRWSLIMGGDTAKGLLTWHEPEQLAELCEIVVVNRLGNDGDAPDIFDTRSVTISGFEVSSSDIRRRVADGDSIRFLVCDVVVDLIEANSLYRQTS